MQEASVVVVGAGAAGLSAATRYLARPQPSAGPLSAPGR